MTTIRQRQQNSHHRNQPANISHPFPQTGTKDDLLPSGTVLRLTAFCSWACSSKVALSSFEMRPRLCRNTGSRGLCFITNILNVISVARIILTLGRESLLGAASGDRDGPSQCMCLMWCVPRTDPTRVSPLFTLLRRQHTYSPLRLPCACLICSSLVTSSGSRSSSVVKAQLCWQV